jgi:hypothetical protein
MGDNRMRKWRPQERYRTPLTRHLIICKCAFTCKQVLIFQAFNGLTDSKFHFLLRLSACSEFRLMTGLAILPHII